MRKKIATSIIGFALVAAPVFVAAQSLPTIPQNPTIEQLQQLVIQLTQILQQLLEQIANRGDEGSIRVTAPNGGEQWEAGVMNSITWAPYGYNPDINPSRTVDAYLETRNADGSFKNLGSVVPSGKASIHWVTGFIDPSQYRTYADQGVGQYGIVAPGQYYIRVVNYVTGAWDRSDAPFTVLPKRIDLKVNGSDGPVTVDPNAQITLSWTASPGLTDCKIYGNVSSSGAVQNNGSTSVMPVFGGNSQAGVSVQCKPTPLSSNDPYPTIATNNNTIVVTDTVSLLASGVTQPMPTIQVISPNGGEQINLSAEKVGAVNYKYAALKSVSVALYKNDQWFKWIAKDVLTNADNMNSVTFGLTPSDIAAQDLNQNIFKIYVTGQKADGISYIDDKSDAPFSFSADGTSSVTATYRGYLNGSLFITTNNISEADALANCKLNAANNPTKSIRCTWGEKQIYSASGVASGQTNPVVINSFTASASSVAAGQPVTFSWSSNLTATDINTYGGGCMIEGLTPTNVALQVTSSFNPGSGSVTYTPSSPATYTLRCTSNAKDGSPSAQKTVTVSINPFATAKPSCSISYFPTTITQGQTLMVSWAGTADATRTYSLARNGAVYFTSGAIAASGNASALYSELGGPGTIVRTDTVTNSGGTSTCTTSVVVAANDRLTSPNALTAGQSITSPNGQYHATYQSDGHFVVTSGTTPVWYTGAFGVSPGQAVMQSDGNFVNYNAAGAAYWNSQTNGRGTAPYSLIVQDNGTLVIKDSTGASIWATGTVMGASTSNETNLANSLTALQGALQALVALFAL